MRSTWLTAALILVLATWAAVPAEAQRRSPAGGAAADVLQDGYIFNIVEWDGGELPKLYERSDQLPLTLEDIRKLSAGGFSPEAIVKMIEERRCACDASVESLIALKGAGVSEKVLQALSLHALPPNRSLVLTVAMDFEGLGGEGTVSNQARKGYLYLIIPDGGRERIFMGNLQAILRGHWRQDTLTDTTDPFLPKKVRHVTFAARVPLKTHGAKKAMIFTSTKPDIYTSADIPKLDRKGIQEFTFDYPVSSPAQDCRLQALYKQDSMLPEVWHPGKTHFECEWN